VPQVSRERLADVGRQRQPTLPAALARTRISPPRQSMPSSLIAATSLLRNPSRTSSTRIA
jgi:hypothetical protein